MKNKIKYIRFVILLMTLIIIGSVVALADIMKGDEGVVLNSNRNEPVLTYPVENSDKGSKEKKSARKHDWNLVLVNPWNQIPKSYTVYLTWLKNGHAIDERCYPKLQQMLDDCRAAGLSPVICSSYRTWEKQERLYRKQVDRYLCEGYSQKEAEKEGGKTVAIPGTSEHQLGLAVDIVDIHHQQLDESQEKTMVQQWLMKNSWKYGFILRYPPAKSKITGIIYEPWHYRYVGLEAAKDIYNQGVCLEEYLDD